MIRVAITKNMREKASLEAQKRDAYIQHHFEINHLSGSERDELGFLGEFACCALLGIDWEKNIRENYLTIDDFDFMIHDYKADVKTETVPYNYAKKILEQKINDDELYGRRLINKGQFNLLNKYDIVIFGLFVRDKMDYWYPIGYIESEIVLTKYPPTNQRPDGGYYPFDGSPVPTSKLKSIKKLM